MEFTSIDKRRLTLDDLAQIDENGVEFWYARDLQKLLGYAEWRNFELPIGRAQITLETTKAAGQHHFVGVNKMVELGSGAKRQVKDYKLTRYACYLIAMNGDPRKEEIAFAQAYFAVRTRASEVIEERMAVISRIAAREGLSEAEKLFSANMFERGVTDEGIARVRSKGDEALFGGHTTSDMKRRLGVPDRKPLADHLPRVTIAAKHLATELTNYNIEEQDMRGEEPITEEHVQNNSDVRDLLGRRGVVPENLPAEEDVRHLERKVRADERELERDGGFPVEAIGA